MNAILAAGTGLSNFACSAEECLSWIIILLNILTVFYLVFCAWFKVTKTVKIIGYVWASALTVATIAVVAAHTCIFTVLSAVFTALVLMAVLSVVFNKGVFTNERKEEKEEKESKPFKQKIKVSGAYVIHKTDDDKYVFVLYNNRKVALARSWYKYDSVEETKKAIAVCRENGYLASVENKTKDWIDFARHPKFLMYQEGEDYRFYMTLMDESIFIISNSYEFVEQCEWRMKDAVTAVKSNRMYYSDQDVLSGSLFKSLSDKKEEQKKIIKEKPVEVKEEPVESKEEKPAPAPVEEVAAVEAKTVETKEDADSDEEEVIVTDNDGHTFRIIYNKSFRAKLMQSSDEIKGYYTELKNDILSYKPTKSRMSWLFDSINTGKTPLVRFGIRGKTLCVYYALNADDYADSKYKVEKLDASRYEGFSCAYRIKNNRRLKFAKHLIADVCEKAGLQQGLVPSVDYSLPYESTPALIQKGLIKEIKVKK